MSFATVITAGQIRISRRAVRALVAVPALIATLLTLAVSTASAGRADPPGQRSANHCINFDGVDYNVLYGISDQFIARPGCLQATAGEHWTRPTFWSVSAANPVYPVGYAPAHPTPMQDFLAKVTVVVVVDGGTHQEKTHVLSSSQAVRTDITTFQAFPGGVAFPTNDPMASILPRMRPLSIGTHTTEQILLLSAQHCDGLGTDVDVNCLPAGETLFGGRRTFTVTPPPKQG